MSPETASSPPLPKLRVDDTTGQLLDPQGRITLLRGLNAGGRSKWSPFLPFELADPDCAIDHVRQSALAYFELWPRFGLNAARLLLSWEAVEPSPGVYDQRYLDRLGALLDAAAAHSVYVILDFHQDLFSAPLMGDGFPRWALPEALQRDQQLIQSRPQHRAWFLAYLLDKRVAAAFDRLWRPESGLLTQLEAMWRKVLEAHGDHPALLGIELINEPGWGSAKDLGAFINQTLLPAYDQLISALHQRWPELLICYGMPGAEFMGLGASTRAPQGYPIAYAPHLYDPSLLLTRSGPMSLEPARILSQLGRWRREMGVPVFLGEFGVTHDNPHGADWILRVLEGADQHHLHTFLWECSASPLRWNFEDLNVLEDDAKTPRPALLALSRPWLRALSGQLHELRWSPERATLSLHWSAGSHPSTLSLGPRRPTQPKLHHTGALARSSYDPARNLLHLSGQPGSEQRATLTIL